jgi:glycosyltransferase involved in cell wall biosynthesis
MPSVDIAIPCYQYGRFLGECVRSVQAQGIDTVRILIIDNASTDDSVAVARQLAAADPRIAVTARPVNLGAQASYNAAIDWAASDYMMILCADDVLPPGALRRAVAIMEQDRSISFAFGRDIAFRDGGALPAFGDSTDAAWTVVQGRDFITERCTNPVATASLMVRTTAQKQAGHYRPALPFTDDLEMMLRLAAIGNVAITDAAQGVRRLHGANLADQFRQSRANDLIEREKAFGSFFTREGAALPEAARLRRTAERYLAERAYWWALRSILSGKRGDAADLIAFALRRAPSMALLPPLNFLFRPAR